MFIAFIIGVIAGFLLSENWVRILAWLEATIKKLQEKTSKKK